MMAAHKETSSFPQQPALASLPSSSSTPSIPSIAAAVCTNSIANYSAAEAASCTPLQKPQQRYQLQRNRHQLCRLNTAGDTAEAVIEASNRGQQQAAGAVAIGGTKSAAIARGASPAAGDKDPAGDSHSYIDDASSITINTNTSSSSSSSSTVSETASQHHPICCGSNPSYCRGDSGSSGGDSSGGGAGGSGASCGGSTGAPCHTSTTTSSTTQLYYGGPSQRFQTTAAVVTAAGGSAAAYGPHPLAAVPSSVSSHNFRHFQQEHPRSAPAKPTVLNLSIASPATSSSSHRKFIKVYTTAGSSRAWARTPSPVKSFCTPLGTPDLDDRGGNNGTISANEPRSKSARTFYSSKCPSSPIKVRSAILQIVKLPDGTEEAVVKRTPEEKHRSPYTLSLNRCNLHQCPAILDECGLQVICYRYNHIVEIDNMSQMKMLYALDLTANHINRLTNLYTFTNLKVLVVAQNRLTSLEGIECLESLEILDASANQLRALPESAQLSRLHTLNIAENRVANLKNVWHFPSLVEINAKRNLIKQLGGVEFLDRLHKLFLSCNQIESLDALGPLSECTELCELTLNGCPVAQLPNYRHHVIANVGNIKYFDYKPVLDEEKRSIRSALRREEQRRIFVEKMEFFEKTVSRVRLSCKNWWTALEPNRMLDEVEQARRCGIGVFVHSEAEMRCEVVMPTPGGGGGSGEPHAQTTPTTNHSTPLSATSRASSGTRYSCDRATILEELTHRICDLAAFQLLHVDNEYEKLSLWGPAALLSALVSPVVLYDRVQTLVLHCSLLTSGDTLFSLLQVLPNLTELLIEDCALRTLGDLAIVCNAISKSADQNKLCSLMVSDTVTRSCHSANLLAIRCLPQRVITFNSNVVAESQREAALRCFPSQPHLHLPLLLTTAPMTNKSDMSSNTTTPTATSGASKEIYGEGATMLAACVTRTQALYNASILLESMLIMSP
ncbi:uncharacterized protein LOC111263617 isoform X1 [Varroa jacobsoni]|uniref:uncharacterized protein LOC111263617 isoform X1 n=1 Tax=Varroa jacobsoni TaxID=62625 RepID=UPI000BF2803E|nr:uncharacterized protein LOC111263617 isoform X1 [Varroa jacobsoni]XP_022694598.1 uncharacterized protein LOC111263617 isoform X1 [Varroa jacobsoni]